ncbi:1c1bc657-780e-4206-8096-a53f0df5358b [Sclerotinia trifoliorum]|uniref:1c1bc657-780e-4206-8096-a53f0df5358b n=1 Tax=Sclerotinia trifoliorum TaxID=28548 RepID=A0A8H2VVH3_9HELO|nr:1c1bc657-780e-4206-8096-a53f0df5358b [Sclerotinia trifoliorum]
MENNHHSRKRKHAHEHKSRLGESGKHHKHSNYDSAHRRHPRNHSSGRSAEKMQPLAIRDQNELSGDKDYIRSWLAQTQNEGITDWLEPLKQTSAKIDLGYQEEKAKHSNYIDTAHIPGKSKVTTEFKPKPDQETVSFDSSLLEAPRLPVVKERARAPRELSATYDGKKTTQSHKHRKKPASTVTSTSSQYSVVQPKQETFEKKARHKTKEDRYDPKKKSNQAEVAKPIKTRRGKRGDRKKAARKASQDLMNNFASNKIGLDRLSVRPSNGPGIFQNGRASSPARRRGLPDLAFSEMEFLQRSSKKSHLNDNIVVPKSRAKEKRKAARAQDEIAAFFKPSKTPVRDNSSIIEHPTSPISIHGPSLYERQLRRDREHDQQRYYSEKLTPRVNEARNNLKESSGQQLRIYQLRFPPDPAPQFLSKNVADCNMYSEAADTIVTWSESQSSPGATMALRRAREQYCQRQNSTTPDSVRSSMEKTGIFKDTGIEISSRRKPHMREAVNKGSYETQDKGSASTADGPAVISRDLSSLSTNSAQSSHEISPTPNFQQQDCLPRPLPHMEKKTEEAPLERRALDAAEIRVDRLQRTVVEYYDPNLGWYRKEDSKPPSKSLERPSDSAVARIPTPLTRQQMARNARIKRPSTTLPVIREASDESRENSSSSISGIPEKGIQRTESAPIRSSIVKGDMSGDISPVSGRARQHNGIPEPQVREPMSPQPCSQSHHGQHSHFGRSGLITNNINGNAILQGEMMDEEGRQLPLTRGTHLKGRTRTPLGTIPCIISNSEHFQFSTEPPFQRGFSSIHGRPKQHTIPTPRSPLIRLPSLYVQQLEIEQEKDQMTNGLLNGKIERHGAHVVQGPKFNTESYGEDWNNTDTEQEMTCVVEDVLENRHCTRDLGELGPQEANACEAPLSRHEVTGIWYEHSNLDYQSPDQHLQHNQGHEYNQWNSDNLYLQEPLIETQHQQNLQQLHETGFLGNQLVQRPLPQYWELEGRNGNASEDILMQRFWRPNPQY